MASNGGLTLTGGSVSMDAVDFLVSTWRLTPDKGAIAGRWMTLHGFDSS